MILTAATRTYVRVNVVVDAMACEVIFGATVSFVGCSLAIMQAGGQPAAELFVVTGYIPMSVSEAESVRQAKKLTGNDTLQSCPPDKLG